jgi:hypothetical protein
MILQCDDADESCGFPGDEGTIRKKCGEVTEGVAENSSLSKGLFTGNGKMAIFTMSTHYKNGTNLTGSKR